jgi:L-aminopeptidase/D-esterase-like protein
VPRAPGWKLTAALVATMLLVSEIAVAGENLTLTAVPGITVGHITLPERPTGCTVVLVSPAAVAGVDVRGAAPGTRETDLLSPINTVERVNAIVLAGGSAFGLDAASGTVRWLDEHGVGF